MEDETEKDLVGLVLSELEMSREYIRSKFKGTGKECKGETGGRNQPGGEPSEVYKNYNKILTCIEDKIAFYKNLIQVDEAKRGHAEKGDDRLTGEKRPTEQRYHRTATGRDNFFEEYEKNKSSLYKMKKKAIVGYTAEGNAIIINNDRFCKMFTNYNLASDRKNGMTGAQSHGTHQGGDDLSELSCSSSSVVSLHSFVKSERAKRIRSNRKAYVRHKYHDNAFVNHKLYPCSDCSSSSFSWYSDDYDDLFYYSNLLKEDKRLRKRRVGKAAGEEDKKKDKKKDTQQCNQKKQEEKHNNQIERDAANESPFYNYIYFKFAEKDQRNAYPVFINTINGKKKMYNLKKICRITQKKNYSPLDENKYELDATLFSYKQCKLLPSVKNETKKKGNQLVEMHRNDVLKRKHFESDEINYAIDKIIHQLGKISSSQKEDKRKFNHSDHFNNILNKNREFLKREKNFTFQKLCKTEKIRLKVKIIGTDGKEIKNKSLDNVLINKNKTFGDLATHLGHSFKLPKDKIENIKMYFDGDLCDKGLTFDNVELGLEDGFQIDVKFPLSDDNANKEDEENLSDDNYVLYLPDSYVID
ncbi:hypothetical protein C922_00553 [Plasmodium inui San Antonio 1]|uniref:Uncharacterized protein n=1 Tax=Plasmodium inui San Antonio 1 TaxID=1237626 RepID=W7AAV8_9APIC|nr:hypothetical protein C922_00553 [Plasmodium inui San Antonio 1]EUD68865.1 hypothetical protein C922_00553 [Plasmodium inui San Antonio 1]